MITLSDGTTTVNLPPDLYWSDEWQWQAVEQKVSRTLTGAIIVEACARLSGRPITLEPIDEGSAWVRVADYQAIRNWANVPLKKLTLSLRGASYLVVFRHHDSAGLTAKPVVFYSDMDGSDFLLATIRLMEVSE